MPALPPDLQAGSFHTDKEQPAERENTFRGLFLFFHAQRFMRSSR